jgi:2-keto-4-pentenoate hydratase/2-oxohepta-3-ene-1,7-dioic acid hydratase in catechol pathway
MGTSEVRHVARYRAGDAVHHGVRDAGGFARLDAPPWLGGRETGTHDPDAGVTLLAPVVPTKIVCVGLNYRAHIAESASVAPGAKAPEEPLIFLKPASAVIASGEPIRYPHGVTRLDPEAELGLVIGRRTRGVSESEALACLAGLTCFNDVSARNYQRQEGQWTRAKGFDTFAPVGPWVTVGVSADRLDVTCRVNGGTRQQGNTADLLFAVPALISFISHIMTLEPGDIIATGTPAGIAPVEVGDRIEIEVSGVGVLENRVEAAPAW